MRYAILIAALLMAGCGKKEIEISPTDNAEVKVERLFTHDGCTVYRFYDSGTRYFVRCEGAVPSGTQWRHTYQCGKTTCSEERSIPGA